MEQARIRLFFAIKFNDVIGVEEVLKGVNNLNQMRNSIGQTPLMLAVMKGSLSIVELLLDAGADPNQQDFNGATALMFAWDCDLEITKRLVEAGADYQIKNLSGETALDVARRKRQPATMALFGVKEKFTVARADR